MSCIIILAIFSAEPVPLVLNLHFPYMENLHLKYVYIIARTFT